MKDPDLNAYAVFTAVADYRSLARAAERLGMPRSTVSKKLIDLERRLGVRLFQRTTRRVDITPQGKRFYDQVASLLDGFRVTEEALRLDLSRQQRSLVIAASPALAKHVLGRLASRLVAADPTLRVEIRSTRDPGAPLEEDVDFMLSAHPAGRPPGGAEVIAISSRGLYGAPEFLARRGEPKDVRDLDPGEIVAARGKATMSLRRGRRRVSLTCAGPLDTGDCETVMDGAAGGGFFAVLPDFLAAPLVRRGELVRVLEDWSFDSVPVALRVSAQGAQSREAARARALLPEVLRESGVDRAGTDALDDADTGPRPPAPQDRIDQLEVHPDPRRQFHQGSEALPFTLRPSHQADQADRDIRPRVRGARAR